MFFLALIEEQCFPSILLNFVVKKFPTIIFSHILFIFVWCTHTDNFSDLEITTSDPGWIISNKWNIASYWGDSDKKVFFWWWRRRPRLVSSDRYLFQINSFFANYVIKSDICSNCMKFSMDDLKKDKLGLSCASLS